MILISLLIGILAGVSFTGCSGKKVDENDPKSLYEDAEDNINSDQYQIAIDKLRVIRNKFPYSSYSTLAQLRIADVYYLQDSFAEAAAAYEAFVDLHPKHEKVGYALFRIAKSYLNDTPENISRDLSSGYKAQEAYHLFMKRFPNAPELSEAKKDLESVRNRLAEKELQIGNFYLKRDQYSAATVRFEKLRALYPETSFANEAKERLEKLAKIQDKISQRAETQSE